MNNELEGIFAFGGGNNISLRKFLLYPLTTEYKEVGKRNFTTTRNVEEKIEEAVSYVNLNSKAGVRGIVDNDLDLVKLKEGCDGQIQIDGGIQGTRYAFILIFEKRNQSGNIVRTFFKGYTSAFELSLHNNGKFSAAVPDYALFYLDSVSTVTLGKRISNGRTSYIATDDHRSDHILKSVNGQTINTLRPMDVSMGVYLSEHQNQIGASSLPNVINGNGGSEALSSKDNGSATLYTKKLLDGVMTALHEGVSGTGFGEDESGGVLNTKDIYTALRERDATNVPVLKELAINGSGLGRTTTILTVNDLKNILGVYSLDGLAEVITHDVKDIELAALTCADADNMGRDTITVGAHDLFNNIQAVVSRSGIHSLEFSAIVNTFNMLEDKYIISVNNFDTIYGNSADSAKLTFIINNLKNSLAGLCLEPFDKFMRFDEHVSGTGVYVVHVRYVEFTDCIISIEIGDERIMFRYPVFASSALSPVTTDDMSNSTLHGISQTLKGLKKSTLQLQNIQTEERSSVNYNTWNGNDRSFFTNQNVVSRSVVQDERNYFPDDGYVERPEDIEDGNLVYDF